MPWVDELREISRCSTCGSPLGCALDCSNAPWNHDRGDTVRLGYLKRFVAYRGP